MHSDITASAVPFVSCACFDGVDANGGSLVTCKPEASWRHTTTGLGTASLPAPPPGTAGTARR